MSQQLGKSLQNDLDEKRKQARQYGRPQEKERPLQSIVIETDLEALMSRVILQNQVYEKEYQMTIVPASGAYQPPPISHHLQTEALKVKCDKLLKIPKRPLWTNKTTKEDLENLELQEFYQWRKRLAVLESCGEIVVSPYEKNIEIWRQLWRLVERSDVIFQIVDARNPIFFRCADLEAYVQEMSQRMSSKKKCVLLLNKADLLTNERLSQWIQYFADKVDVLFYSATETDLHDDRILSSSLLIKWMTEQGGNEKVVIGFVGYPNVGKSSTINSLFQKKKVAISATPGKTKYLQTLILNETVELCDCPGLVFPSFSSCKAEFVINGVLSVDQF
ncbi:hypothetical protein ACOME3_003243 [Neoechinorhynchus agilis]